VPPSPPPARAPVAALPEPVWPLIESGTVKPVIDRVLPLGAAPEAHRLMESSTHVGKVPLQVCAGVRQWFVGVQPVVADGGAEMCRAAVRLVAQTSTTVSFGWVFF
jgi:hypothetical protein